MRKISLLLFLIVMSLTAQAQKEANNWAFGQNAGLTWNTTRAVLLTGVNGTPDALLGDLPNKITTSIFTTEGCFSLSDANGNLLFYSDGVYVMDRNNGVMPNGSGLTGDNSAAQSGIIFPYPGNVNRFVAVTTSASYLAVIQDRLNYSIIDMSLPGNGTVSSPRGNVVSGQKNIRLSGTGYTSESCTTIKSTDDSYYWIIAPGRGNPTSLNAWKFTSSGVTAAPTLVTSIPTATTLDVDAYGYIKMTPDGKHFVWATTVDQKLIVGDFDNATGAFSNIRLITLTGQEPYGVDFSPSQKYLYVGTRSTTWYIFDFDALLAGTTTTPLKTFINPNNDPSFGFQLGPDLRMYHVAYNQSSIYIIDNPDEPNSLRQYKAPSGFLSGTCQLGLPSFSASWFEADAKLTSFDCLGSPSYYRVEVSGASVNQATRLEWNFGDGSPIITQTAVPGTLVYKQSYDYAALGNYTVTTTFYNGTIALATVAQVANVVECSFQTNRMIRANLLNSAQRPK